jgi:tetratricopeptide (TPR) repeat protein
MQDVTFSAMLNRMPKLTRLCAIAMRVVVACACLLGAWSSLKIARAERLFRQDSADAIRSAIVLAPDNSAYFMRLAQLDESHAVELLRTALRLDNYNAQADIELGLQYEAGGDPSHAEMLLLQAAAIDHTYLPRWSLANFYLRHDNIPAFWIWARSAAEMPGDDVGALFELCWRVSPDPDRIAANILNDDPQLLRQYLEFLLGKGQLQAATGAALRLVRDEGPETDRERMFLVVNQLVDANYATEANELWHQMIQDRWVVAETTPPNNRLFSRIPQPVSFDWALSSYDGLHSWPGPNGLETEFTGEEPESCTFAEQTVVLEPGNYILKSPYLTNGIEPDTGIRWQIVDARSNAVLAESSDLSSDTQQQLQLAFSVAPGNSLVRLRLVYKRSLGTTRIAGTLVIPSIEIQSLAHL